MKPASTLFGPTRRRFLQASVAGLAAPKTDARFAFRYYKTLSPGAVGGYIGIDEVTFTSVK